MAADLLRMAASPLGLLLLGLCVGSFLNVVVRRWPLMMERQWWSDVSQQLGDAESRHRALGPHAPDDEALQPARRALESALASLPTLGLARPGSHCPSCGHVLRWRENVPLLSWLLLRGRCSACGVRIGLRYPLVEAGTAALFLLMGAVHQWQPVALLWSAWAAALLAMALIDWDTTWLPDALTLPWTWAGLLAAALGWTIAPVDAIAGAAAGYLSLWAVFWLFKLVTGKDGMGYGDFKLMAGIGAWLGWSLLLPVLLLASLAGAAVGLLMKARGELREGRYVPFGPFLAAGALLAALWGEARVLRWLGWA